MYGSCEHRNYDARSILPYTSRRNVSESFVFPYMLGKIREMTFRHYYFPFAARKRKVLTFVHRSLDCYSSRVNTCRLNRAQFFFSLYVDAVKNAPFKIYSDGNKVTFILYNRPYTRGRFRALHPPPPFPINMKRKKHRRSKELLQPFRR